jgi:hypothetical protein
MYEISGKLARNYKEAVIKIKCGGVTDKISCEYAEFGQDLLLTKSN